MARCAFWSRLAGFGDADRWVVPGIQRAMPSTNSLIQPCSTAITAARGEPPRRERCGCWPWRGHSWAGRARCERRAAIFGRYRSHREQQPTRIRHVERNLICFTHSETCVVQQIISPFMNTPLSRYFHFPPLRRLRKRNQRPPRNGVSGTSPDVLGTSLLSTVFVDRTNGCRLAVGERRTSAARHSRRRRGMGPGTRGGRSDGQPSRKVAGIWMSAHVFNKAALVNK